MQERLTHVKASIGFCSETGQRKQNEDFAAALFGGELPRPRRDVIAAIADGMGGAKGGRIAAETAVRGFLDGFCDLPETMEVPRAAQQVTTALNKWIYAQGRQDPRLAGMGCTFTALVLRGRMAHMLHVGDTRAYRLSGERLTCLTTDHSRGGHGSGSPILTRALGVDVEVRLDYLTQPVSLHDRFMLCSDGVHGVTPESAIAEILLRRRAPADTARELVTGALQSGSTDNCTCLVVDVVELPLADAADIGAAIRQLPVEPLPQVGDRVDGFVLKVLLSEGSYSRLFGAVDEIEGGEVAMKFPTPQVAAVAGHHASFVREACVGARVNSPWVGRIRELPPGRQTRLYTVMPLYIGELLETRLQRPPALSLEEGRNIAIKLARGAAALHRVGIIHRDIKPDNVILESGGSLKLIDLGVVAVPELQEEPEEQPPGTRAYMAPEMLQGVAGTPATDLYALGVTMFRAFTGEFPFGNSDAMSPPRRDYPKELLLLRPDLPAWLQTVLTCAMAHDPADRFHGMLEFAVEMENGPAAASGSAPPPLTLYQRAPVRFWQVVAALLALALIASLLRH